jgi:type I restriction enzyme S subunit
VTVGELREGEIHNSKEHISDVAVAETMPSQIPVGTLLFSFKLSIGKMAVAGVPLHTNEAIAALVIRNPKELSRNFLYYALKSKSHDAAANGAVLGRLLNKQTVQQIEIPVPPLAEQERIVKLLDEADALRKLRAQVDQRTAQFIPALFHEMFGDPATNPIGWPIKSLGQVAKTVSGGTPDRSVSSYFGGRIPWVKSGELHKYLIETTSETLTEDGLRNSSAKLLPPGTILIAMYGATVGAVSELGIDAATNQAVCAVTPEGLVDGTYLRFAIQQQTSRLVSQRVGGAQPNISQKIVSTLPIPVPPLARQEMFAQRVRAGRDLQAHQGASRDRLDAGFQAMLYHAFAGEL